MPAVCSESGNILVAAFMEGKECWALPEAPADSSSRRAREDEAAEATPLRLCCGEAPGLCT